MPSAKASDKRKRIRTGERKQNERDAENHCAGDRLQTLSAGVAKISGQQHARERAGAAGALEKAETLRADMKHVAGKHRHQDHIGHAEHAVEKNHADENCSRFHFRG